MKTVAIIQARMASTRLPNKVLADVEGRPMLARVVSRVRAARRVDDVVVATSTNPQDDAVAAFCEAEGVACFRGSESDVLDRYYQAAGSVGAELIVRITADCPLHDPAVIDAVVARFDPATTDYVSNAIERTFPDGLDTEAFSMAALERAWREAEWTSEREHVTSYIWKHPDRFRLAQVTQDRDLSGLRWTVDEPRDLAFVREVYRRLGDGSLHMEAIADLLASDGALRAMNDGIDPNEGYKISLSRDQPTRRGALS